MAKTVFVDNKMPHSKRLGLPTANKDGSPRNWQGVGITDGGIDLRTGGNNEVDAEAWEEATKNAMVQWYLENGHLAVLSKSSGDDAVPDAPITSLSELKQKDALAAVANTFQKPVLERFREGERRKVVLDAIQFQMDKLSAPADEAPKLENDGLS